MRPCEITLRQGQVGSRLLHEGVEAEGQGHAESTGSDGASPYLSHTTTTTSTIERRRSSSGLPRFLSRQNLVRGDSSQFVDTENSVFDQVVWTRSASGDTDDGRTDREPVFRHYFPLLMEVVMGDAVD
jgi:hypothetical protein